MRECGQIEPPPHSLHVLLMRLCGQMALPFALLARALDPAMGADRATTTVFTLALALAVAADRATSTFFARALDAGMRAYGSAYVSLQVLLTRPCSHTPGSTLALIAVLIEPTVPVVVTAEGAIAIGA